MTSKTQQSLHLPEGITTQQQADAVSAKMRARQEYPNAVKLKIDAKRGLRTGSQKVNVGADVMRAMYVVGMGKDVLRITDVKNIVNDIMPEFRIFHYRYMHGDNVELLAHKDDYDDIARVVTGYLHKTRGE